MPLVIVDRVKQTTATTGSGTLTLSGVFGGFQSFGAIGDGNETFYCIENYSRWEVGIGTYNSAGTLTRDTVMRSSAGGAKINLQGLSTVFCTYPADRAVYTNASGFLDLSTSSGLVFPDNMNFNDVTISGDLSITPYTGRSFTIVKTSSGNLFQGYTDTAVDRTIALYTDGTVSPQWRLGVKDSPDYPDQPPEYGYVFGEDGCIGLYANSLSDMTLKHTTGFNITHQSTVLVTGNKTNGVTFGVPTAGAAIKTTGSGDFGLVRTAVGIRYPDNSLQTTAFLGLNPVSGQAAYASGQIPGLSSSISTNAANIATNVTNIAIDSGRITTNVSSISTNAGSISTNAGNISTNSSAISENTTLIGSVSGWAGATFLTSYTDTNTTYTAGSGLELVGTVFHFIDSGKWLANTASGIVHSGYFEARLASLSAAVDYSPQILANSASGVAISGWVNADLYGGTSSPFVLDLMVDNQLSCASFAVGQATFTQGLILKSSGHPDGEGGYIELGQNTQFEPTYNLSDDSAYIWVSGNTPNANVAFTQNNNGVFTHHVIADSGYLEAKFAALTDNDTTYTAGSGLSLVGTVFHWTESGIPIANSGYFQYKLDSLPTTTDYGPQILANSASGTAISGWAAATFLTTDSDTTYTAGSGMELVGNVFHWTASGDHPYVPAAASVNNSGRTYIQDITLDSNGHITAIASATETVVNTDTTYTAGSGLSLVGTTFHWTESGIPIANSGYAEQVYLKDHPSVSAASSSDNSGRTYIQDILLDSNGHVIGLTTATETVVNTDTDTTYTAGSGMELVGTTFHWTQSGIPIANSGYFEARLAALTDNDTTYTAGSGLTLVGTEFNTFGSGNFEGLIVDKAIKTKTVIEADGATITFNMNDANTHATTLGGNRTIAFSNAASGQKFMVRLRQDGTGSRTVTWPGNIKWQNGAAPTLSTAANHADMIGFVCTAPNYYDGVVVMSGVR